ncbi:MAG: type II toxin-antitoxin system VapC family toxin [Mucilaginibacter sp.]|uniref:type II toxin-antitoxin system VapC family toxin n=1 Tax=Mucilaginibacter sp. TaxID=1882438 RepID=UPI0034E3A78A
MKTNLLIDTNVLIYTLNKDSVYHQVADDLLLNPNYNLFVTTKNISEFFAVASKLKIALSSCLSFYAEVKLNFTILFPSITSLLIFEKLVQQYQPKGNLVFDLEIVSIMLDNGIDQIATFNQKDFVNIKEVHVLELP